MDSHDHLKCPLCEASQTSPFYEDTRRAYNRCATCNLVFVPPRYHLTTADEKAEYDLHENAADDPGYRRFLNGIFEPVHQRLRPRSHGLDFGSGPGPTLSVMFEEVGHRMAIYDPFYSPDRSPLARQYDFVTASEVVEHFRNPRKDLDQLKSRVKPGGLLAIKTKLALDRDAFARWHYKNDRTHISFFSRETHTWLANQWGVEVTIVGADVAIFDFANHKTC